MFEHISREKSDLDFRPLWPNSFIFFLFPENLKYKGLFAKVLLTYKPIAKPPTHRNPIPTLKALSHSWLSLSLGLFHRCLVHLFSIMIIALSFFFIFFSFFILYHLFFVSFFLLQFLFFSVLFFLITWPVALSYIWYISRSPMLSASQISLVCLINKRILFSKEN